MLAGSGILAATGGFRNGRSPWSPPDCRLRHCRNRIRIARPVIVRCFPAGELSYGACSPLTREPRLPFRRTDTSTVPRPRFRPLRNHHGVGPCPWASQPPPVLRMRLEAPLWFVGSGATMVLLAMAMLLARASETWGKEIPGRFNSPSIPKKRGRQPSVQASAFKPLATTRYCTDIPHRAPYSSPTIIFRICRLAQGQNARAPAIGQKRKIDVNNLFLAGCASSKTLIHKRRFNLWNS